MPRRATPLADDDYRQLLALRTSLRGFLHWSETRAKEAGLTGAQHQLLLAVRGHDDPRGPTIGEVADYLFLRHHSAVGLVDRADQAGLVHRWADPDDARIARVLLTRAGRESLEDLSQLHVEELARLSAHLRPLLQGLSLEQDDRGGSRVGGGGSGPESRSSGAAAPR